MGTGDGVNMYDGTSFTHFTSEQGLFSNGVNSLLEASDGKFCMGTGGGIKVYYGTSFSHFTS